MNHKLTSYNLFQLLKFDDNKFSTSGKDGNVIVWNIKSLESAISELKIV